MSDELNPIELELMSLFDRDLSTERRATLIEKLQDHPEILEKYSAYLHLQDIELTADDTPPKYVRENVLKAAYRRNRTLRWKERLSNLILGLMGPAVAGPAVLCLAILVGYELMDSTTANQGAEDIKAVSSALEDTISLEKQSASEKALIGSKTPKRKPGEPSDDRTADSTASIDGLNLDSEPAKIIQKSSAVGSIAGNSAAISESKSKVRSGAKLTKRRSTPTQKGSRKTRLKKVKSALSQSKSSRVNTTTPKMVEAAKIGEPKPRDKDQHTIEIGGTPSSPAANRRPSSEYVVAAMASPEDSASPEDLLMERSVNQGSLGTRDAQIQRSQEGARMRSRSEISQRKQRRNSPAKLIDSDLETPEVKLQASKARNPRQLEMVANENADADEDMNMKAPARGSSSGLTVDSTDRKSFDNFVRSLNRSESLDGIPSPILLEMAEIGIKLKEYSKAQLWLRNVLGRQDEFKDKANLLFKKLRARQDR